jgi:tetratricopeptide (TPR) repeat protein
MGEHDRARSAFERALLIEPEDVSVLRAMLRLERDLGDFEKAQEWSDQALAASRGPEDLSEVYDFLETLYYRQGQFERVEETYWKLVEAQADEHPVNAAFKLSQMLALQRAHEIGREAWAFGQLDSLQALMPSPFDDIQGVLFALALAESGETERARLELERGNRGIASFGAEVFNGYAAYAAGRITEQEGGCRSAAERYRQAVSADPLLFAARAALGRCQRELGELEAGEATFQQLLTIIPADAKARVELARVYEDMGRTSDAIEQLRLAADIWKNADPDYIPAMEAQEMLIALAGNS